MYDYDYSNGVSTTSTGLDAVQSIFGLALFALMLASLWKIFEKAKQPGWKSLVPLYNSYILLKIVGRPGWWLILMLIPLVNFIIVLVVLNDLAKSFGKDFAYTIVLFILPFIGLPMLGFGSAKYKRPVAATK